MKSFQDEYKYGSSADLGFSVKYSFSPMLAMDYILVNGEGYKKVQLGKGLLYGIGITLNPISNMIFGSTVPIMKQKGLKKKALVI